jgi:hypothetical protein
MIASGQHHSRRMHHTRKVRIEFSLAILNVLNPVKVP